MTLAQAKKILKKRLPPHKKGCPAFPVDISDCTCPVPKGYKKAEKTVLLKGAII